MKVIKTETLSKRYNLILLHLSYAQYNFLNYS